MQKQGVVAAGDALMDQQYVVERLPERGGDERIISRHITTGGAAANTAYALARMGVQTVFLGCMGRDVMADQLGEKLQQAGVDISLVQYDGKTGYTVGIIDAAGERTMLSYRGASARAIEINYAVKKRLSSAVVFLVSGYLLTNDDQAGFALEAAEVVKTAGGLVALDPCPVVDKVPKQVLAGMLTATDILLPNAAELAYIQKEASDAIKNLPCIALKLGEKGARLMLKKGFKSPSGLTITEDCAYEALPEAKKAVDTTGAGDAFNAGLIAAMMKEGGPEEWLVKANQAAALCIARQGAVSY